MRSHHRDHSPDAHHPGSHREPWWHKLIGHSHDSLDSVDAALESSRQGIRAVKVSLVALGVTALLQLLVVAASGSVALLADTVHNFSDALTAVPLWVAFALAGRAASRRYTYGLGRVEDAAGLFIVAMIALSAVVAGWQSLDRLLNPVAVGNVGWVAAAGIVGFLGNELVAIYRIRIGRRIGSVALVADGLHARTDGLTSLAVVAGAAGVAFGWPVADPIIGMVITLVILWVLFGAARDVFRRILDGVDPTLVDVTEHAILDTPGVIGIRGVRLRWIGHELRAEADIEVDPSLSVAAAHTIAHEAEHQLNQHIPRLRQATIHVSPAGAH